MKLLLLVFLISSCAIVHHVQQGELIRVKGKTLQKFDVKISETGVNVQEAGDILSAVTQDEGRAQEIANVLALFQMGPTTGNPVFNEKYADVLPDIILKKCPSGKITGLLVIREMNSYPVVSGEIVRVQGYCIN